MMMRNLVKKETGSGKEEGELRTEGLLKYPRTGTLERGKEGLLNNSPSKSSEMSENAY